MSLAISVQNLRREFKGKVAVENLNLNVSQGEIYGFLGPNGAGKSTTVKMLTTLLKPTSGSASILGRDILSQASQVRLLIGAALQEISLDETQTGEEILWVQGRLYGLNKQEIAERIKELIPLIDIGDSLTKPIKTYSGGMKRRLDLAASIIHNPQILFLDEPTTGLDPVSRAKVWQEVQRLNKENGMTIFLTTQYLEEADQLADRVGIINQGKLAKEGTPKDLKNSVGEDKILAKVNKLEKDLLVQLQKIPGVTKVELQEEEIAISTSNGSSLIGQVAIKINESGVEIRSLTLRTTTLDDVFLEVTGNHIQ